MVTVGAVVMVTVAVAVTVGVVVMVTVAGAVTVGVMVAVAVVFAVAVVVGVAVVVVVVAHPVAETRRDGFTVRFPIVWCSGNYDIVGGYR